MVNKGQLNCIEIMHLFLHRKIGEAISIILYREKKSDKLISKGYDKLYVMKRIFN